MFGELLCEAFVCGNPRCSNIKFFVLCFLSSTPCRYHGTKIVEEDGRYKTSLEIDQKLYYIAKLEINNVETSDQGTYRAVASNRYGEGVATINLNFEGSDKPKYANHVTLTILNT